MGEISMYAVDTAKSVFQVYGEDAARGERAHKRLRRAQFLAFFERSDRGSGV